jgi:ABC-type multidrug transport system fused ATPase/permease subunit
MSCLAEYVTLQSEEAWLGSLVGGVGEGKNATSAPSGWPHSGGVTFANYSMAYREGLPLVLDGVNLEIKAGDKVQTHKLTAQSPRHGGMGITSTWHVST